MAARGRTACAGHRPARTVGFCLLVVVMALTGACGGATKFEDEPSTTRSTTGSTRTVPQVTAPPITQPATTTTTAVATSTSRRTVPPSTSRATSTTRAPAPTVSAADRALRRAALGPPGGAAGIILAPAPATSLVVEVLEEPGAAANRATLDRVVGDLRKYSGKPVTEVHTALPAGSPDRQWTEDELDALADRTARAAQGGGQFAIRLLSVRGRNARSASILAVSFRGDTFALFPDRAPSSGPQVVTAVTMHELGHLLGLVDLYLDRGRADTRNDPAGGGHSANTGSVMYFAVDPSTLGSLFGTASDRYDAQDERDLAAIRAGAPFGSNPR